MDAGPGKHVAYIVATPSGDEFARKIAGHLRDTYLPKRGIRGVDPWVPTQYTVFADTQGATKVMQHIRGRPIYVVADVMNPRIMLPPDPDSLEGYIISMTGQRYAVLDKRGAPVPVRPQRMMAGWNTDVLCSTIECVKNASSGKVVAVVPYFPNQRQDKREDRESLDLKRSVEMLKAAGANAAITIDVHNIATPLAFDGMTLDSLRAARTLIGHLRQNYDLTNAYVMSPDSSANMRNKVYYEALNCDAGTIFKRRNRSAPNTFDNVIGFMGNEADVKGKDVFMPDDIIDTGGSSIRAAERTKELGAARIYLVATFGGLTGRAIERIEDAVARGIVDKVIVTNAVAQAEERPWLDVVDVSKYFAKAIDAHCNGDSLSALLQENWEE